MGKAIAAAYGVKHIEVLTGFKYIGEQMLKFEKTGCNNYVFGMEESYGCLPGTYARDKDAPAAVCMLCEVAAFYKSQGKTLWDGMIDMYEKYGYYREGISTMTLKGIDGAAQINEIMTKARAAEPKKFGDYQVLAIRDYKMCIRDRAYNRQQCSHYHDEIWHLFISRTKKPWREIACDAYQAKAQGKTYKPDELKALIKEGFYFVFFIFTEGSSYSWKHHSTE